MGLAGRLWGYNATFYDHHDTAIIDHHHTAVVNHDCHQFMC
jgi:hypothetical protein